jgi:hypothetical protein
MWTRNYRNIRYQCYEAFGNECMHILESFFLEY